MSSFDPNNPSGAGPDELAAELAADERFADRSDWTLLGSGGFGAVFRVNRPSVGRREAVKVLWRALDPATVEEFQAEARILGGIGPHPALITVYDAGVLASGRPFVVTEYAPGGTLANQLAVGPMPWKNAVTAVMAVAGGLQRCHDAGILHLDVKPSNVLLDAEGRPRLADFGVARTQLRSGVITQTGAPDATGLLSLTVAYSPPEMLEGRVSVTTDVYMLAATLHALCAGSPPFPRPARLQEQGVPKSVAAVIDRALDPDPDRRPASVAAFAEELRTAVDRAGSGASRRAAAAIAAVAAMALLAVGVGLAAGLGGGEDAIEGETTTATMPAEPEVITTIAATAPAEVTAATTAEEVCDIVLLPGTVDQTTGSGVQLEPLDVDLRSDAVSVAVNGVAVNERITANGATTCADGGGSIIDLELTGRGWGDGAGEGVELTLRTGSDTVSLIDQVAFGEQPDRLRLRVAVTDPDMPTLTLRRSGIEESLELRPGAEVSESFLVLRRDPTAPFVDRVVTRAGAPIPSVDSSSFRDPEPGQATFQIDGLRLAAVTPDGTGRSQADTAFVWLRGSVEISQNFSTSFAPIPAEAVTIAAAGQVGVTARWFENPAGSREMFAGFWVAEVPWDVTSLTVTITPTRAESNINDQNDLVFSGSTTIEVPIS